MRLLAIPVVLAICCAAWSQGFSYKRPPQSVTSVMEELPAPTLSVDPTKNHALLVQRAKFLSIAELAAPMVPLAGSRINPRNNGPARPRPIVSLSLIDLHTLGRRAVPLPSDGICYLSEWAPDGRHFALAIARSERVQVAVGDTATGQLRLLPQAVNGTEGAPFVWMPDSRTLLVRRIASSRGEPPSRPAAPDGPEVQESLGRRRPARTLPDALKDSFGDSQFAYYMSSQLSLVDIGSGRVTDVGKPGILRADPSPDGHALLVEEVVKPFSRRVYANGFARKVSVWNLRSGKQTLIARQPSEEGVPLNGVITGPRDIQWRSDEPESLLWAEAQDGGDPEAKAEYRDRLVVEDLTGGSPKELLKLKERFERVVWTATGGRAVLTEYDYGKERTRRWLLTVGRDRATTDLLSDISTRERYANPGNPIERELPNGKLVLVQTGDDIFLDGQGGSATGDHPFLDRLNLATKKTTRIWQCDPEHYEYPVDVLAPEPVSFVTSRQSPAEIQNYFIHTGGAQVKPLTSRKIEHPELLAITKQLVKYHRADGVELSFTLYLPPNYKPGEKLPAVVYAYPLEFTDPSTAGQVTGSTKTFPTLNNRLLFLLAGYAVMDDVAMPIVGDPKTVNDSFVPQLVADAEAAVNKAKELGSIDTDRLGVTGHSYGAFMTVNLLAHCGLFKAGAAESGAYNRTLTPFGFQSERRTFWQAPKMYLDVSPFSYADRIKLPLLLIHGLQDDNPGTYTIQSERLYQAVSGNGGTTRLVLLPYEAHGYAAKESVEHVIWEEIRWFDRYVKGAK